MRIEYLNIVSTLNNNIINFNKLLSSEISIPLLDISKPKDVSCFVDLKVTSWKELKLPNMNGVYFIFGHDSSDVNKTALYIGKASYNSIGKRLGAHLGKDKYNENFTMNHLNGKIHILEYFYALDLDDFNLNVFSASLEEYLIFNLRKEISLLNGIGNY